MKKVFVGSTLAMAVTLGMAAFAQSTGQPPVQSQPPATTQPPATAQQPAAQPRADADMNEEVTLVGCVQREEDYRTAHNMKAGTAGTGVGMDNEFVLVHASKSTAMAGTAGTSGTAGTTGGTTAAGMEAYELTGAKEAEVKTFLGKRVEITGKLKKAETGATGTTGGATAGNPPTGVDVTSEDLRLREIDVTSVKASTGTCPAGK